MVIDMNLINKILMIISFVLGVCFLIESTETLNFQEFNAGVLCLVLGYVLLIFKRLKSNKQ